MSDENKDIVLEDSEYGIKLTSDQVDSLFTSDGSETPNQMSAPEPAVENSEETATAETETQATEQPSEDESVSTEEDNLEDLVFVHNDTEYSNDDLTLAIEALQNRDEWQKSNTQKSQQIAEERKQLDNLMSRVNNALQSDEVKEYFGSDHELFKSVEDYKGLPEQEQKAIDEPVEDDRVTLLEDKIMQMEAEKQVDKDIGDLIIAHPELQGSTEALNDVLEIAITKNLSLEDAYVFATATSNGESALLKAIKTVEEAKSLKSQPEARPSGKGQVEEPIPVGKSYDEIADIALSRYNLMK
tara:strand:+ start:1188 stop:2087 length:900 start_codon:yes stop_codon:yes gene_type:complete